MSQNKVLGVLQAKGVVLTDDHLVYTSGRHGSAYVNKDAIFTDPSLVSALCFDIAEHFNLAGGYDVVVGPVLGGIILAQWTAYHASALIGQKVLAVYAEKDGEAFVLRRGYDQLVAGKRVLVVEDILTTGSTVRKVVAAVRAAGGEVIGVGALCNRGEVTVAAVGDVPELLALVELTLESWPEADCPLCLAGQPINTAVGKGREFLARKKS